MPVFRASALVFLFGLVMWPGSGATSSLCWLLFGPVSWPGFGASALGFFFGRPCVVAHFFL